MESNIKGLVAAGHEMASELKAECGAVDMRSVAKLISDLATQLEVQLVRANALAEDQQKAIESIKQADSAVKLAHEKFSVLAAENELARKAVQAFCDVVGDNTEIISELVGQDGVLVILKAMKATGNMSATDAFLAEVRAEARNEGINYTASRLAAAFNHGFINKPLAEVFDVTRMILSAKEELANEPHPIDGLSGEYAEKSLEEWAETDSQRRQPVSKIDYQALRIALDGIERSDAMLHGAEPVSQTYKLNQLSGNSPVTPDGWISCSERMPDDGQEVVVQTHSGWRYIAFYESHSGLFYDSPEGDVEYVLVTHWMPLPEPPQQDGE